MFELGCFLLHVILPLSVLLHEPLLGAYIGLSQLFLIFLIIFILHSIPAIFISFKIIRIGPFNSIFKRVLRCHYFMVQLLVQLVVWTILNVFDAVEVLG